MLYEASRSWRLVFLTMQCETVGAGVEVGSLVPLLRMVDTSELGTNFTK